MMSSEFMKKWEVMSPEEKTATLDAYHGLSTNDWGMYECSDCDPAFMDEDDEHYGKFEGTFKLICRTDQRPDYCPRCLSYLSLGGATKVFVTTGPAK